MLISIYPFPDILQKLTGEKTQEFWIKAGPVAHFCDKQVKEGNYLELSGVGSQTQMPPGPGRRGRSEEWGCGKERASLSSTEGSLSSAHGVPTGAKAQCCQIFGFFSLEAGNLDVFNPKFLYFWMLDFSREVTYPDFNVMCSNLQIWAVIPCFKKKSNMIDITNNKRPLLQALFGGQ